MVQATVSGTRSVVLASVRAATKSAMTSRQPAYMVIEYACSSSVSRITRIRSRWCTSSAASKVLNANSAERSAAPRGSESSMSASRSRNCRRWVSKSPQDRALGRVVAEQGASGDARGLRDVVDADGVEAVRAEQLDRDLRDVIAGGGTPPSDAWRVGLIVAHVHPPSTHL